MGGALETIGLLTGPILIDQGWGEVHIGWLQALPVVAAMLVGSLVGGYLADAWGHRRGVVFAQLWLVGSVVGVATVLAAGGSFVLLVCLLLTASLGIGMLTAVSYALLMDITRSDIAATQWSAFMGAGNGCESWSHFAAGRLHSHFGRLYPGFGYPLTLLLMCLMPLASLLLLRWMRRPAGGDGGLAGETTSGAEQGARESSPLDR